MFEVIEVIGESIEVVDLFTRLSLDTIGVASFGNSILDQKTTNNVTDRDSVGFDFNSLKDQNNEWVLGYNSIKEGMVHPLYILFPIFDTKLVRWIPSRLKAHDNLTNFLNMLGKIIEHKRQVIREKKQTSAIADNEKDLLTLMIESEMNGGDGEVLSNEELKVGFILSFPISS